MLYRDYRNRLPRYCISPYSLLEPYSLSFKPIDMLRINKIELFLLHQKTALLRKRFFSSHKYGVFLLRKPFESAKSLHFNLTYAFFEPEFLFAVHFFVLHSLSIDIFHYSKYVFTVFILVAHVVHGLFHDIYTQSAYAP